MPSDPSPCRDPETGALKGGLPQLYGEDGEPVNVFRELGKRKSEAKTLAARKNGAKGGPKSWKLKKIKHGKPVTKDLV